MARKKKTPAKSIEHPTLRWEESGRPVRYRNREDLERDARRLCDRFRSDGQTLCGMLAKRNPAGGWHAFCGKKHGGQALKGLGHPAVKRAKTGATTKSRYVPGGRIGAFYDDTDTQPERVDVEINITRATIRALLAQLEEHDAPDWRRRVVDCVDRMERASKQAGDQARDRYLEAFDELRGLAAEGARFADGLSQIRHEKAVLARLADTKTKQAARKQLTPEEAQFFVRAVAMTAVEVLDVALEHGWAANRARSVLSERLRTLELGGKLKPLKGSSSGDGETVN